MPPVLRKVEVIQPDSAKHPELADYWLLPERGRKDVLINLEMLRAWGTVNQSVIEEFNKNRQEK